MGAIVESGPFGLMVIGTNYRRAPLAFREKLSFVPDEMPGFLQKAHEILRSSDCFILSTCNRTEFYTVHRDLEMTAARVRQLLVEFKAIDPLQDSKNFYEYRGQSAIEQLFRVACGIDSQMLGEPQILAQVKNAYDVGLRANVLGVVGDRLLASALRCGKRARTETAISNGAVSVAFAAVNLGHKVFGDFAPRTALVIGAGQTGTLVSRHLREHGIGRLLIANRTFDRARSVATEMRGEPLELSDCGKALREVDMVVTSTSASNPLLDDKMVQEAMRLRQNRTLLIIDIGVPRDVGPGVRDISNVFLHDLDDLQVMIDQTLVRRRREVPKVEHIISEEVRHFIDWFHGMEATPVIKTLRGRLEAIREQEIIRHTAHLSKEERAAVEQVTRGLLKKLLHRPTRLLRESIGQGETGLRRIETVRELFGLDESLPGSKASDEPQDPTSPRSPSP